MSALAASVLCSNIYLVPGNTSCRSTRTACQSTTDDLERRSLQQKIAGGQLTLNTFLRQSSYAT